MGYGYSKEGDQSVNVDYSSYDAVDLARLLKKDITPTELVNSVFKYIKQIDKSLNPFSNLNYSLAMQQAKNVNKNTFFNGVPFALKDIGAYQTGLKQSQGNRALKSIGKIPEHTSPLGQRFLNAGLVTIGSTISTEFGALVLSDPNAFGYVRNPWNREHTVGGSSAGAAAAVASGLLPMAHARDGGGSIRAPASFCGLVGLKPSRGRVPAMPSHPWNANVSELGMTRTVRDTALLLDTCSGNARGDIFRLSDTSKPFADYLYDQLKPLRIGVMAGSIDGLELGEEASKGLTKTIETLQSLGHHVEESSPNIFKTRSSAGINNRMTNQRVSLHFRYVLRKLSEKLGRPACKEDVEPVFWEIGVEGGPDLSAVNYLLDQDDNYRYAQGILDWWDGSFDLLLTPTTPFAAPTIESLKVKIGETGFEYLDRIMDIVSFTSPFNLSGQPAISLPLHMTSEGLPLGMQFVADIGREDLLLRLAAQLEKAMPWADRRPPVYAQ